MARPLTIISSMATRGCLADLTAAYSAATGSDVQVISIGGVDAANRVRSGTPFDAIVLANDALQRLGNDGFVDASSIMVFARSPTALAIRAGAKRPTACDEAGLKQLLLEARAVGISSGPSGAQLRKLIADWDLGPTVDARLVEAQPGIPVARLIAGGAVDVGFQQLSELAREPGIDVIATLPAALVPLTDFAIALPTAAADAAAALVEYMLSKQAHDLLQRHFLQPA